MRRAVAVVLAVALLIPGPAVVAAHGNEVEVDPQVSADGTVLVERGLLIVDGFLVVHRDAGGEPGEVIGHATPPGDSYAFSDVRIPIDDAAWSGWGANRTVWVAIHRDEGGDGFDPGEDPIERSFGTITGERIQLGKDERETSVVAAGFSAQRIGNDTVTARRVAIGTDGLLAVATGSTGGEGQVIGATAIEAGVHENVSVAVDGSVFAERGRRLTLVATLYRGDGPTVTGSDRPLRVGGEPIRTRFDVVRTGTLDAETTPTGDGTDATGTTIPATTAPLVVTPTPAEETPTSAPTGTDGGTTVATDAGTGTGAVGPGPGAPAASGAVLATVGALVLARRRG